MLVWVKDTSYDHVGNGYKMTMLILLKNSVLLNCGVHQVTQA